MTTEPRKKRRSEAYDNQQERLFDLLPDDLYEEALKLSFAKRLLVERWFTHEATRLSSCMARSIEAPMHRDPAVMALLDMLASDPMDPQAAASWLNTHRVDITVQLLAELVSAAMGRGVLDLMSARAGRRQADNREKKERALLLWKEEYAEKMSKGNAAPRIAETVGLAVSTVRRYLQGL